MSNQFILIYNVLNIILFPFYILLLLVRMAKGKENIKSIKSRLAIYGRSVIARSKTTKQSLVSLNCFAPLAMTELIWIHAASVGESMIAITLVNELQKKYVTHQFLITTGTLSSANIINKALPHGVYHEFTPLDNWFIVRRFYQYWKPTLGIFLESEIWPTLVSYSAKSCKLVLFNARLSDKSFNHWQKYPKIFQLLTSFFSYIAVQSDVDFKKYHALGADNSVNLGNLKFVNQKLPCNTEELDIMKKIFINKKILVAASTHLEDELVILDIISKFKKQKTKIYPIIILRHPERRSEIILNCQKLGLTYSLRSDKSVPSLKDDVYIVDSFGELGLFYSLSNITFIGGSFKIGSRVGGHNLLEPAYFDNVIIVGPDMSNFQNITDEMVKNKAAVQIQDSKELEEKILFFLADKNSKIAQEYSNNAKKYVDNKEKILTNYLQQIDKFLND